MLDLRSSQQWLLGCDTPQFIVVHQRFGETYRLHLQDQIYANHVKGKNQAERCTRLFSA
jgi:hypothetical protein